MGFTISTRKEATVEATLVKLSGDLMAKLPRLSRNKSYLWLPIIVN